MPDTTTIVMLVALFGLMYFMLIRPAQRKARDQQQLVNTIQPGARIMTGAGIFGTVRHIGDRQAIIEISPGVELTVAKQAILRVVTPDEDEFEYDDAPVDSIEDDVTDHAADDTHEVAAEDAPASDDEPKR